MKVEQRKSRKNSLPYKKEGVSTVMERKVEGKILENHEEVRKYSVGIISCSGEKAG